MPPKPTKRVTRSASGRSTQQTAKKRRTDPAPPSQPSQPTVSVPTVSNDTIQSIVKAVSEAITKQLSTPLETPNQSATASSSGTIAQQPSSSTVAHQPNSGTVAQQPSSSTVAQQPISSTVVQQSIADAVNQLTGSKTPGGNQDTIPSKNNFISVALPLGSAVQDKIKSKIWADDYIDLGSLLTAQQGDDTYSIKLQNSGGHPTLSVVSNQKKLSITTIDSWTNAFLTYIAIYTQNHPNQHASILKYMSIIRDLASNAANWKYYDETFRSIRKSQSLPWDQIHTELWLGAHNIRKPSQGNFRPKTSSVRPPFGYCFKYHTGTPCHGCSFKHQCSKCGGNHPLTKCSQTYKGGQGNRSFSHKNTDTSKTTNSN